MCLVLAMILLLGTCTLFASCGGEPGEVTLTEKVELDVKGYAILYADSGTAGIYKKTVNNFATSLKNATGKSYSVKSVKGVELAEADTAILVGDTGFEESENAKDEIDGVGFAIHVSENRIAIVGSDELLTIYALQYFMDNYLAEHEGGTVLNIPEKATANELPLVVLADSENGGIPFVYGSECHEETSHPVGVLMSVYARSEERRVGKEC